MELPLYWSWISQTPKTSNKSVLLRYKHAWLQTHFWQVRKFEKGHLLLKADRNPKQWPEGGWDEYWMFTDP